VVRRLRAPLGGGRGLRATRLRAALLRASWVLTVLGIAALRRSRLGLRAALLPAGLLWTCLGLRAALGLRATLGPAVVRLTAVLGFGSRVPRGGVRFSLPLRPGPLAPAGALGTRALAPLGRGAVPRGGQRHDLAGLRGGVPRGLPAVPRGLLAGAGVRRG